MNGAGAVKRRREYKNAVACNRCKKRKQRCDGNYITGSPCSKCMVSGEICEFDDKTRPSYVKSLEDKVRFLEKKVGDLELQRLEEKGKGSPGDHGSVKSVTSTESGNKNLVECTAFIPLKDDSNPIYVGSSSFSIANLIQYYLIHDDTTDNSSTNDIYEDISGDPNNFVQILLEDQKLMDYFLESYITIMHKRYPFLDRLYIESLHERRSELFFQRDEKSAMDRFLILMIYAVGSYLRPNNSKLSHVPFARMLFYKAALNSDLQVIFKTETTANIYALLLLVVYKLRTPNGQVIWYLIGMALRLCIDFGLHRRNIQVFAKDPYKYQLNSRLFWSTYSLDRIIANSFGRPYSISDRDIDVDLPLDIEESIRDPVIIKNHFYSKYPQYNIENLVLQPVNTPFTTLTMAIKNFELRRIDSKIQEKIYAVDKSITDIPRDAISEIKEDLNRWKQSTPQRQNTLENDYYSYLYNKLLRHLIIPFINLLDSDDPLFTACIDSSITICKTNRRIHDNGKHLLSIISIQTIFLSGMTIIYAVLSKKMTFTFKISEGLRCCSATLLLLSTRSPSCKSFSLIFERLLDRIGSNDESEEYDSYGPQKVLNDISQIDIDYLQGAVEEDKLEFYQDHDFNTFMNRVASFDDEIPQLRGDFM